MGNLRSFEIPLIRHKLVNSLLQKINISLLPRKDIMDFEYMEHTILTVMIFVLDSYLWYLFPTGANRIYGYDTLNNLSFNSNPLPVGTTTVQKEGFHGLCIPAANEIILGHFADRCLGDSDICESFTMSFLVYVKGPVAEGEDVHILYSTPLSEGLYHVQFTITQTVSRLEGQASIVGGNSASLLERKGTFPGVNKWVHVVIMYSQSSQELDLYFDSVMVTDPNSTVSWNNTGQSVKVSLAAPSNKRETCVSYFQIIRSVLTSREIQQLQHESRSQGEERQDTKLIIGR